MEAFGLKYDLSVAGGGFTGVAGAVAAAREGAKVLLLERYGFLGGAACACYVNPFMRYTLKTEQGTELLSNGIFEEILDRLDALGGLKEIRDTFSEELLKLVLDRLTKEAGGKVLFHSYLQACLLYTSQVREKDASTRAFYQTALQIKKITDAYRVCH